MTSDEKMDLDAIDKLAWYTIIDFLDEKSRLHCRHFSRSIKECVDWTGLTLHALCSKPFENENEDWKAFLKNPDIHFFKVHFSSGDKGETSADNVGLTPQHRVKYLHVKNIASHSFKELSNLLKVEWTRNIHTLVCNSYALSLKTPKPEDVSELSFPSLRKLYLIYNLERRHRWIPVPGEVLDTIGILNILLRKLRSKRMELVFVKLYDFAFYTPTLILRDSLAEFVQAHAGTLETVIFQNSMGIDPEPQPIITTLWDDEFRAIPTRLKYFDVDFFAYLDPHRSSWFKMLNSSLRQLKGFVSRGCQYHPPEDQLNHTSDPNLLVNLCRLNCNTLNYVFLTIRNNDLAVDLNGSRAFRRGTLCR